MADEPTATPEPPPAAPSPQPPPAWQAAPPAPAPGIAGFVYADVPNRIFALIIDFLIIAVMNLVITMLIAVVLGQQYKVTVSDTDGIKVETNFLSAGVTLVVTLAASAVYWIYSWTRMRGSPGMKVLGMQVGNYPDGATLTQNQAIRRWVALGGPLPLVQSLNQLPLIGVLLGIGTLAYFVYLLYSTATSPTKRGFHDMYANSVVVKAARGV
jgi:uncharacterized RDD family membrane protein YckC